MTIPSKKLIRSKKQVQSRLQTKNEREKKKKKEDAYRKAHRAAAGTWGLLARVGNPSIKASINVWNTGQAIAGVRGGSWAEVLEDDWEEA